MSPLEQVPAIVTLAEAAAFARIETGDEEALTAGLIRTASALCESFINRLVIARPVEVELAASGEWERLPVTPVRAITAVTGIDPGGAEVALASGDYAVDVDSSGDGWVRLLKASGVSRLRVTASAGMAEDCNGVPEPLRQGVLRLVAHLLSVRDGPGGDLPAAVTALWRPYRRLRLG